MKNETSHNNERYGTLYVVSTPIGNLEDVTLRALRILDTVDIIAAENVTHTKGLCEHYNIRKRITKYHQHNQRSKTRELLKELRSGKDVALVTDAGTPGISDPGVFLIRRAANEAINVVPIPGASAVIAALSVSGLATDRFVFVGFLSNKPGKRKNELKKFISEPRTMVFFEAPHRVKAMLMDVREMLGNREMVMLREMTKMFEEIKRGPVSAILDHLNRDKIRGEFTLVVAGNEEIKTDNPDIQVMKRIDRMLAENMGVKDIAQALSSEKGLSYRGIYKECLARKKTLRA